MRSSSVLALALCALFTVVVTACGNAPPAYTSALETPLCEHTPAYAQVRAFKTNCELCHASGLALADRQGAPVDVNFDTYARAVAAASDSDNEVTTLGMPPLGALPDADRLQLLAWLRCGTPE